MSSSGGRSNPQPAPFVPPTTAAPVYKKYVGIILIGLKLIGLNRNRSFGF